MGFGKELVIFQNLFIQVYLQMRNEIKTVWHFPLT